MRGPAWTVLLALALACGRLGPPQRHPPQPRVATGSQQSAPQAPRPDSSSAEPAGGGETDGGQRESEPTSEPQTEVMQP